MDEILVRNETSADVREMEDVTIAAFKTLAISNKTEQFIIAALRAAKALTVSLVAELNGRVVGHVAFSPVTISDGTLNWFGLGPVSVLPEYQRKGIGSALIREGLSVLEGIHAQGCCLVGDPEYYRRFGFRNMPGFIHEGIPQEVFLALTLDGHAPRGVQSGWPTRGFRRRVTAGMILVVGCRDGTWNNRETGGSTYQGTPITCSFRLSVMDVLVLLLGIVLGIVGWNYVGDLGLFVPFVIMHFFLLCNIFRIRRKQELLWAGLFLINCSIWIIVGRMDVGWIFVTQFVITAAIIVNELRSPHYCGIFSHRIR